MDRGGGITHPLSILSLSILVFFVLDRHDRSAPAEREMTGATPPPPAVLLLGGVAWDDFTPGWAVFLSG